MDMLQREHEYHDGPDNSGETDGGGELAQMRASGNALFSVGDAAARRSLSKDSVKFNKSLRQEGGQ